MSRYEGGQGTREDSDLVRWTLDIDEGLSRVQVYSTSQVFQTRPVQADLTLHAINKKESEAIIALVNEMRSASRGVVIEPGRYPSIGDRFRGLEFE